MKVVYDTCLYIDFLRSSRNSALFEERQHIRFLSPVVVMELTAGARSKRQLHMLERMFRRYSQAERLIQLSAKEFFKAGEVLSVLRKQHGRLPHSLSHDVLIAASTASIGATLFTSNRKDFELIKRFLPTKIEII